MTRRWLVLPSVASTLRLSLLKSLLSEALTRVSAFRHFARALPWKKVLSRISSGNTVTRWVVTCRFLTLLLWSACGGTGEFYARVWNVAGPTPGVMLTLVGVWSLTEGRPASCRFFKPRSANVQPSRLFANLLSGCGPFSFFFFEGRKTNSSDTGAERIVLDWND